MSDPRPLTCRQVAPYLSALADGELAEPLRSAAAAHAASCAACGATLARHESVNRLMASLSAPDPAPDLLQRVLAARAPQVVGPVTRESLRPRRVRAARAHRPGLRAAFQIANGISPTRARPAWWVALPALAAVLVLALALFAFQRGPRQQYASSANSSTQNSLAGDPLGLARAAADGYTPDLGFTAALPAYLPAGARFASATVTPAAALGGAAHLDVIWTLNGTLASLHVRESAQLLSTWSDYKAASPPLRLAWQLPGHQPWREVTYVPDTTRSAVAQSRAGVAIAVDVAIAGSGGADDQARAAAENVLRLASLSMDASQRLDTAPLPPDPAATVIHYTATGTVGGESYGWEAYLDPVNGRGRIDVRDAGGTTLYSDVFSGGNLTRFDPATRVYQRITADQLPAESALRSSVTAFFAAGYSYVQAGKLWDVGVGQWRGRTMLQFALTTAPYLTYVYADPATLRIAGASVDPAAPDHPGTLDGPSQLASTGACLSYSLVEYLGPAAVPTATFEPTPPLGYTTGQTRAPVTCGG